MNRKKFIKLSPILLLLPSFINSIVKDNKTSLERRNWKEKDIRAGLYITRAYPNTDIGNIASRTFQIGYNFYFGWNTIETYTNDKGTFRLLHKGYTPESRYMLNSVADGWSHGYAGKSVDYQPLMGYSKKTLVEYLNNDKWGYRPISKKEMHDIIDNLSKNFL